MKYVTIFMFMTTLVLADSSDKAALKATNQVWVRGCFSGVTAFAHKHIHFDDGTPPESSVEVICAGPLNNERVKARIAAGKDLLLQGCIDGINMAMRLTYENPSNGRINQAQIDYCM